MPESGVSTFILGGYRALRELGRGSRGVVYVAEHPVTGLRVAVKLLSAAVGADPLARERLSQEAVSVNRLAHEGVVNVFDVDVSDPARCFLVMEVLEGESLAELATRPMPVAEALPVLEAVAQTLDAAHAAGLLHLDLTAESIFLARAGRHGREVKLLPFGVAAGASGASGRRFDFGAPQTRAPELTADPRAASVRADVYSLGAVAYQLATGRRPFAAVTEQALQQAHERVAPEAPHRVVPEVSPAWSAVILRALEKAPERRFASMAELAKAFGEAARAPAPVRRATTLVASAPVAVEAAASPAPAVRSTSSPVPAPAPTTGLVLRATVSDEEGAALGECVCSQVTRAGLFVGAAQGLPGLMSLVRLVLPELGPLECRARVVQHVTVAQAEAWRMSPGFAVQFEGLTAVQRSRLEAAQQGLRAPVTDEAPPAADDEVAARTLAQLGAAPRGAHYALLGAGSDAPFDLLHERFREVRRKLDALETRPLSRHQKEQQQALRQRLEAALAALGTPAARLEHDAAQGNFEGVARCISAGLPMAELEEARARFLVAHPAAAQGNSSFLAGQLLESKLKKRDALEQYAAALKVDPLNLGAQQRYWALRRALATEPSRITRLS